MSDETRRRSLGGPRQPEPPSSAEPGGDRERSPARIARPLAIRSHRVKESGPFAVLLFAAALLYLVGLSHNGYANGYYAAAVQAGTNSWKAFLFGSLDAANFVTVDKPPASLWLMELSSRLLGFSSLSMLLPQALEGVAAVALLVATVRRWFGRPAALLSGLILALTPVATLMFRFNNPDALLVLLSVAAAYALTRAIENGSTRWLAVAGSALGFAFLTKELQAFLVLPAFTLAYLFAAPVTLHRRLCRLAAAAGALIVSAGWWVALVVLWPSSARPYIGGSANNSILQLIFGYNGLNRLSGGGPGAGGSDFSGSAGVLRLFDPQLGGQISWLAPAAAIALIVGVVWAVRRPRTDRTRAGLLLWGGWLIVGAAVYSFSAGIIHPYYADTLAPPIAVLVGVGTTLLWRQREQVGARLLLTTVLGTTAVWAYVLLDRTPEWRLSSLRFAILAGAVASGFGIIVYGARRDRAARAGLAATAVLVALAGPAAYTLNTVMHAHAGSDPTAGPESATAGRVARGHRFVAQALSSTRAPSGGRTARETLTHALMSLLQRDSMRYEWVAATSSPRSAAALELATGRPAMPIGSFSGTDLATKLAQFKHLIAQAKVHYYVREVGSAISGGELRPPSGSFARRLDSTAAQIESWVSAHFRSITVGGITVYDLTQPAASPALRRRAGAGGYEAPLVPRATVRSWSSRGSIGWLCRGRSRLTARRRRRRRRFWTRSGAGSRRSGVAYSVVDDEWDVEGVEALL